MKFTGMHHSKVRNHIINKNYYWCYYIAIFISLVLVICSLYGSILSLLLFWLSIISIGCMLINYYKCRSFVKLYDNFLNCYSVQFCKVLIEQKSYKMPVPYKSYNATIQSPPRQTNVIYLETDDFLLLFFPIQYLEIFQFAVGPFIFIKPYKKLDVNTKRVNVVRIFEITEDQEYRTIVFPNKYGISRIIIPQIPLQVTP